MAEPLILHARNMWLTWLRLRWLPTAAAACADLGTHGFAGFEAEGVSVNPAKTKVGFALPSAPSLPVSSIERCSTAHCCASQKSSRPCDKMQPALLASQPCAAGADDLLLPMRRLLLQIPRPPSLFPLTSPLPATQTAVRSDCSVTCCSPAAELRLRCGAGRRAAAAAAGARRSRQRVPAVVRPADQHRHARDPGTSNLALSRTCWASHLAAGPLLSRSTTTTGGTARPGTNARDQITSPPLPSQADYTRYAGTHLAASLTLPLGTRPGAGLAARLPAYLRPKCAPILLDPALMSPATLRLNVYQVGVAI